VRPNGYFINLQGAVGAALAAIDFTIQEKDYRG
jgi:hypothetical protein